MKLKFTLLVIVLGSIFKVLFAQSLYLPNGSAGVGTSTNTNLGIGIGTPLNKLHILGDFRLDGTTGLPLNATNNDPNNYGNIYLTKMTSANNALFFSVSNVTNGRTAYIQSGHYIPSYSASTGILGLNPFGGNVSIGSTIPYQYAQLDITSPYAGNRYASQIHLHTTNNVTGMFLGSYGSKVGHVSVGNHYNSTGNHLAMSDKATGIQLIDDDIRFYTNSGLTANEIYSPYYRMSIFGEDDQSTRLQIYSTTSTQLRLQMGTRFSELGQNSSGGFINLVNAEGVSNTLIRAYGHTQLNVVTGNVGIGTATPDAKLTVKGDIHAQEVRVDLNGAVTPPDYVFEPDYALLGLAETESYILTNKHLPEVPSANQMEENGVKLLEMNMLLLKKIEELTLHMIAQGKLNLTQQQTIEELKERIKLLESNQKK